MIQRRNRLCFLLEAPQPFRVADECRRQNFDRNLAVQPRIACAIDLSHAASTRRRNDLVGP
jgi:hypothetical protein